MSGKSAWLSAVGRPRNDDRGQAGFKAGDRDRRLERLRDGSVVARLFVPMWLPKPVDFLYEKDYL